MRRTFKTTITIAGAAALLYSAFFLGTRFESKRVNDPSTSRQQAAIQQTTTGPLAAAETPCDALAAHPSDPARTAEKGISDDDLDAGKVIEACTQAVKEAPERPRLWFQLARGYLKADRYEEALEALVVAAEHDHGGALAYLGDATLYGAAGLEPDPAIAKKLYQRAADSGFSPASAIAAAIIEGVQVDEATTLSSQAPAPVAKSAFHFPRSIEALSKQEPVFAQDMPSESRIVYVRWLLEGLRHRCSGVLPSGIDLEVAEMDAAARILDRRRLTTFEFRLQGGELDQFKSAGREDGEALGSRPGCTARDTQTLVRNSLRYLGVRTASLSVR
jgi:tetratricopeptide (TPR) repeat protein